MDFVHDSPVNAIVKPEEKLRGLVPESFETYQVIDPGNIICRSTDLQNDKTSLRFGFSEDRGIITSAYMCLCATKKLRSHYAYLLFHTYDLKKIFYGLGSGLRQNLSWQDFKYLPCVAPPLAEQNAIVKYLDYSQRRIRKLIQAKRKLIGLLNEQKQAIIHEAVTRGFDPDVPLKDSGIEWLGQIPSHWEVRRAKAICSAIIDCKNRTPEAVENGEFTVVRTTCIRNGEFTEIGSYKTDYENYKLWTSRGAPNLGDVFFTREAPAGEACLVPNRNDVCMGQRMMYLRPDPDLLDSEFLLLNIYGPLTKTYIELATNGSTVGHLRLGQVYSLPIICCSLDEQKKIVEYVNKKISGIKHAINRTNREIELLNEYRTRLIADVVTGKLDVREIAAALPETDSLTNEDLNDPLEEESDLESTDETEED